MSQFLNNKFEISNNFKPVILFEKKQRFLIFKIVENDRNIHVLNAPSPAATACLSIADEIVKHASRSFKLKK